MLGTSLSLAQKGLRVGASLLRRRLLVDVEITRHDASYQWFLQWMTAYQRAQVEGAANAAQEKGVIARLARRFTPGVHHLSVDTTSIASPTGSLRTRLSLVPGPGNHILRYGSAFIAVSRARETGHVDANGRQFESIKLTALYAHRNIFKDLLLEAHALSQRAQEGKTRVFSARMHEWQPVGQPKRKRPLSSVVLAEGVKERIVHDIKDFLAKREWYLDRGIPYRRGYLLYGPPGTGKTSFIQGLAGEMDYDIAMLNLSERGLTDDRLMHFLLTVPSQTVVVLEDADAAFGNRRTQTDAHGYQGANVTFSGLLNALDGVASAEDRIIFLTTNHIERMDEALIRPGRVDVTVKIGNATRWQVEQLWERFYAAQDPSGALRKAYVTKLEELSLFDSVSTALLQGHFLWNKDDPQGAVDTVESLTKRQEGQSPIK